MAVPRQGCGWGSKLLEFPPSLVRSHGFRKDSFGPLDPSGRIITTRVGPIRCLRQLGHGPLSFLTASSAMVTPKASDDSGNAVGLSLIRGQSNPGRRHHQEASRSFRPRGRASGIEACWPHVNAVAAVRGPMPLDSSTQQAAEDHPADIDDERYPKLLRAIVDPVRGVDAGRVPRRG